MSKYPKSCHQGLILLVVLGMLALFSLISVTYVVFSSNSRSASVALARKSIREGKSKKPLFEEAIKQLIRGTTDTNSSMYGHDLLGDLYGDRESLPTTNPLISIRNYQIDSTTGNSAGPMTYNATLGLQRPMLLGGKYAGSTYVPGHYLRIPLDPVNYINPPLLPREHDALTGRVVTFPEGQGPLGGHSFRVVRYVGQLPLGSTPFDFAQCYSIIIDLLEADLGQTYSQPDFATGALTGTISDWLTKIPSGTDTWASGVYACYANISGGELKSPFSLFFNATPLNSHGVGVLNDGSNEMHYLTTDSSHPLYGTEVNRMPVGLQSRYQNLANAGTMIDPSTGGPTTVILGDSDEPYDAPDFNNLFLAFTESGAANSAAVIPSFHRAALINYIVNWKSPLSYTEVEFRATLRRIELAAGRPLSINVTMPTLGTYNSHPVFSGSNPSAGSQLSFTVSSPWNTNWPTQGLPAFNNWLSFLTSGPWDIDNNGDGIMDSVWMDIDIPLQPSSEGKLLKALVSYYVDDLDSRLDVNATGSAAQANLGGPLNPYSRPTSYPPTYPPTATPPIAFAKGHNQYLPQGFGYGPADVSFRHLFGKPGLAWPLNALTGNAAGEMAYREAMAGRYSRIGTSNEYTPGASGDDPLSLLQMRERRAIYRHGSLPGLPLAVVGRASLGLDRLGNPFLTNVGASMDESLNDPYESHLVTAAYQDTPFTLAEWERIYRVGDSDRTGLPSRLEEIFGETQRTIAVSSLRSEITPISRHLRVPMLAARGQAPTSASSRSFYELVKTVRELRGETVHPNFSQFTVLFPLEFSRGLPMDINRAFGNGFDDDADGEIDEATELIPPAASPTAGPQQAAKYTDAAGNYVSAGTPEEYFHQKFPGDPLIVNTLDPQVSATTASIYRGNETRQLFARHFYSLAQLIVPENYVFPNIDRAYFQSLVFDRDNPDPAKTTEQEAARVKLRDMRSRILAQWAVNVVDFRDSDSSMTRFPYDADPFRNDAGGVDFDWTPDDGVVWGLEQPELLLTESLATHDIRVRKDSVANPKRIDQYRIPEGSLFLELYCPRTTNTGAGAVNTPQVPGVASGLYATNGAGDVVLDVSKLTPAYPGTERFPVWRVYLANPFEKPTSPTAPPPPALKTPHERLVAALPTPITLDTVTRHDLTYQLPSSNVADDGAGNLTTVNSVQSASGLIFDMASKTTERLADPDPAKSRVIVFTDSFSPTLANSPGVADPISQVFVNRAGSLQLHGNQYLVIGPRDITYFGSRQDAAAGASPVNHPNNNRIEMPAGSTWAEMYKADTTLIPKLIPKRASMKDCVTMIAGADLPSSWTSPSPTRNVTFIGVNVSEPLPNATDYYEMPTLPLSSSDTATDPDTGAPGFDDASSNYDAYYDYAMPGAPARAPYDNGIKGPLKYWDLDDDGAPDTLSGANGVVQPGTKLDWCTAYLQRLADPNKPWHATFNPYITVDWIPIDLTVFSGEDNDLAITESAAAPIKFASRQKVGQTMNAKTLAFDTSATGQTFFSSLTSVAKDTSKTGTMNFFEHELLGDEGSTTSPRPSSADGTDAFATLGFLNSTYVLAAESTLATSIPPLPALPPVFQGAPGDPSDPSKKTPSPYWFPDSMFWANRQFVNSYELAYVPISSPGQLMQEFSGTVGSGKESVYAAAYSNEDTSSYLAHDPRMPTSPVSADPLASWPSATAPHKANLNDTPTYSVPSNPDDKDDLYYNPFSHLMSFFRESPELNSPNPIADAMADRFPKNTPVALLLEMVETASPWSDANYTENPLSFEWKDWSAFPAELQPLVASNNIMMAPLRAPYNKQSRFVEPGRVNLNTVSEQNVFQGLWSNTLIPSDIDFPPYAPGTAFGGPEDIDHNANGIYDAGERASPNSVATAWNSVVNSRRGYEPIPAAGRLNPNYPTQFAGVFKPVGEAGMVPFTRNPVPPAASGEQSKLHKLADKKGVLDVYSRQVPAHVTLMRGATEPSAVAGISKFSNSPLFYDATTTQRHVFTDLYPLTRLQNLVSNRSNVFAVYVTIGLFEFDEATGAIGVEYGSDRGEVKRQKAFYIIDRSVPVGYRVGEDNNIENTILLRRHINN